MTVRSIGADSAVVKGEAVEAGVTSDGRKFKVTRRFTDTWKLRKGRWHCVESRVSKVPAR